MVRAAGATEQLRGTPIVESDTPSFDGEYVLTISWHPAFCETKPNLRECRNERASDYAADHFSLHGLWPQDDEYCGVSDSLIAIDNGNRWDDLPEIEVSDATWRELDARDAGHRGQPRASRMDAARDLRRRERRHLLQARHRAG